MIPATLRRWLLVGASAALLLAGALLAALHFAALALKGTVEQALGPQSEVAEVRVGWSAVEVLGVRIRAPRVGKGGWPAEDELRARRILIVPELRALLSSATVRVSAITVEGGYLSVLRSRDGKLQLLTGLLDRGAGAEGKGAYAGPSVSVGAIVLRDCAAEFFDATISQPALKVRIERLEAKVQDVRLPELTGKTRIAASGTVKGAQRDGTVSLHGSVELASRNSDITLQLRGVDLVPLQPYLIRASESGVRRGSLDLDVTSTVRNNRLHAPGSLTLNGLELTSAGGTFMGLPRSAVVSLLEDRNERIQLSFVLDGNLADPRFSLNENFATRLGSSLAGSLGINLEGLAREVGSAGGNVLRGVGDAVEKLLGR
jgi:hypothetical protein